MPTFNEDAHPDLRAINALGMHRDLGGCAECRTDRAPMRYAIVSANAAATEQIAAYLPANYEVLGRTAIRGSNTVQILIGGRDDAGWTLDGYVIPRLASGLYFAEEIGT